MTHMAHKNHNKIESSKAFCVAVNIYNFMYCFLKIFFSHIIVSHRFSEPFSTNISAQGKLIGV